MSEGNEAKPKRRIMLSGAAIVIALLLAVSLFLRESTTAESTLEDMPLFEVQQGPLLISVMESGTIKAREQEVIKNEVEGQTTILTLVEEGKVVEKGELLVELDSSQLQDRLIEQQIMVQNKEATLVNARETFEVVKNQAQSDVTQAELTQQFAQEDLRKFKDGDHPMAVKEAEAKITLSKSDLNRAEEKLRGSERLLEKDFLTSMEFEADKQSAEKAKLDVQLAEASMNLLQNFTYTRTVTELDSAVVEAGRALERAKLKANADVVQAEATLKAAEAEYKQQQDKLKKIEQQIEKTKLYAPTSGLAVYATTGEGGYRGNQEPLEEGQVVRERQELIYLPTTNSMMAEVKLHEASLSKVKADMPVRVLVDALPGRSFTGTIHRIAPLPDAQSAWLNPDLKVYNTEVYVTGDTTGLRTGMSCRVEVLVERYENATYVPVQAVMLVKGKPTAYVVEGGVPQQRQVEIGLDNNRMVNVINGLKAGEMVLLTPPLSDAAVEQETDEGGDPADADGLLPATDTSAATRPSTGAAQPAPGEAAAPGPESAGPDGNRQRGGEGFGPGGGEGRRGGGEGRRGGGAFRNMTPEQREEMRKRFESMSPEEQQRMREQFMQRRQQQEGGDAAPGAGGQLEAAPPAADGPVTPPATGSAQPAPETPSAGESAAPTASGAATAPADSAASGGSAATGDTGAGAAPAAEAASNAS
ncbi:MAG: efflux RND transporter periplasmic adaptor subunit [Candidatus Hydrogenedentes bacterium]|nr:efflux RND transporter periplasmic adaptor subunit [Candidatus Hydrogenedentota bacterium]